ncbi:ABC transporter ATP-binding protein [Flavisphingomonas formosensis]|uniref:ABC transporter ATP-binding protein n=1 Tax=Flavisphingomonas formosensis TaxID=861534 RepID=UPI0012FCA31E|nr:ABC transporter ATP-binding protein [Sphingomonas formosensis]
MIRLSATGIALPGRLGPTDIALRAGELTLLVGPNGAGKTTLLRGMARIGAARGACRIDGFDVGTLGPANRARHLGYLPASRDMDWPLTARDLIALGQIDPSKEAIAAMLERVGAGAFGDRRVDRLSTGERARILLARALINAPSALLLDEPVANLDPLWQLRVLDIVKAEARRGAAVLATVHDLDLARAHAARILVIAGGRIVADGPPETALSDRILAETFGIARSGDGWVIA